MCVYACVWTFAVELEAAQLGVDANRNGPDLVEGGTQCLLVADRNLLIAVTSGGLALGAVLARLVLDTTTTTRFSLKLQERQCQPWQTQLTKRQNKQKITTALETVRHHL